MRTLIKPNELRKRFIIIVILLLAALAAAGSLIGCGDDVNGNNGNGNIETLEYSIDSLVLRTSLPGMTDTMITNRFTKDLDRFKITFTTECNAVNPMSRLNLSIVDSAKVIFSSNINDTLLNKPVIQVITSNTGLTEKTITTIMEINNPNGDDRYLILRNFKLYRID